MIWWGVVLILVGFLLGATGFFGLGSTLAWLGWVLLIIGVVLAIVHLVTARGRTRPAR